MLKLTHWLRCLNLMRSISLQGDIVPERLFDYWGHQHTVGHMHSYLYASQFAKEADILDAGCGSGYGAKLLASCAGKGKVIGIDRSNNAVSYCRLKRKKANLDFIQMDVERMAFPDESFDLVTSFEVIEHFADYESFLSEVRRVLRCGGRFVMTTPNGMNRRLRGLKNPHHVHEFTYKELRPALERHFDDVQFLFRHFRTEEAEKIERRVNQAVKCYPGIRWLTERNRRARLIHLVVPHVMRNWFFCRRTNFPLHWYGPQHVRLENEYTDEAYAFLVSCVKRRTGNG